MLCCKCSRRAETTMKLSGRRSSELGYIGLGQSDWSFGLLCVESHVHLWQIPP
uniref:Uncharacterized protein n=1 Tax=Aegilops tauschii subsp. strangulata TaxID=200361 RepID=A0A453E8T9_AEGTS